MSRSFSRPITTLDELQQAVARYVTRAAEKLRKQRQLAGAMTVFTRTSPFISTFYSQTASTKLILPSNDTAVLLSAALPLVKKIFRPHRSLAKAGVLMQELQDTGHLQNHLLAPCNIHEQERSERLMATIDRLNQRYGKGTVDWAICGFKPSWMMRRQRLSRAATTRLLDIPIVKAE